MKDIRIFMLISFLGLLFRYVLAYFFPMANDGSYYLDWSRNLQLSYLITRPGLVGYLILSSLLFSENLAARGLSPLSFSVWVVAI